VLYVSPDSQLRYLKGNFDADLVALGRENCSADSVVWDIGANCGVLSFSVAGAGQIVAVEADPFLASLLQQSVAMNGVPVAIVPAAAWSAPGELASFTIAARGRASNHLTVTGGNGNPGERARLTVPTISLDSLLENFRPPTLVKIDVEGAEAAVLAGAKRLLAEVRPRFYLEIASDRDDIAPALRAAGYRMRQVTDINWLAEPA
jgi:FkbM family methyltransferase